MAKTAGADAPEPIVPEILLKADSVMLDLKADKEGKIRLNAASWDSPKVLLPGTVLELRWQNGQCVLIRRSLPVDRRSQK